MYPFRRLCRDLQGFYRMRPDLMLYPIALGLINGWLTAVPAILHSLLWPVALLLLYPMVYLALVEAFVTQTSGEESLVRLLRLLVRDGLDRLFDTMSRVIGMATLIGLGGVWLLAWLRPLDSAPPSMEPIWVFPPLLEILLIGLAALPIMQAASPATGLATGGLRELNQMICKQWLNVAIVLALPLLTTALVQLGGGEAWMLSWLGGTLMSLLMPVAFWLVMTDSRLPAGGMEG